MKQQLILFASMFISNMLFGQKQKDTIEVFECSYRISRVGDDVTYYVNGEKSTKDVVDKIAASQKTKNNYEVCFLNNLNLDGSKLSSGIYYSNCDTSSKSVKTESEFLTTKNITYSGQGCKDGKWVFYNSKGEIKKIEYYQKGIKIRKKQWEK